MNKLHFSDVGKGTFTWELPEKVSLILDTGTPEEKQALLEEIETLQKKFMCAIIGGFFAGDPLHYLKLHTKFDEFSKEALERLNRLQK